MRELEEARRKLRHKWYDLNRCMQHLGMGYKRCFDWEYWEPEREKREKGLSKYEEEHKAWLREYRKHKGMPEWEREKEKRERELRRKRAEFEGARRALTYAKSQILREAGGALSIMKMTFGEEIYLLEKAKVDRRVEEIISSLEYIEERLGRARGYITPDRIIEEAIPERVKELFDTALREVNALRKLLEAQIRKIDELIS